MSAIKRIPRGVLALGIIVIICVAVLLIKGIPKESEAAPDPSITSVASAGDTSTSSPTPSVSATADATATQSPTSSSSETAQAAATAPPAPTAEPTPKYTVGTHPQAPEPDRWISYAEDFAAAWGDDTGGKEAWLARLKPHVTQKLYDGFALTDERAILHDTYGGVNIIEESPTQTSFSAWYEEAGTVMDGLAVLQPDGSWLVDKVVPHEG